MLGALPYLQVGEMWVGLTESLIIHDARYKDLKLKCELVPDYVSGIYLFLFHLTQYHVVSAVLKLAM